MKTSESYGKSLLMMIDIKNSSIKIKYKNEII